MRRSWKNLLAAFGIAALALPFAACEEKGPAERAGEKIDEAIEDTGDALEDAGDEVEDAIDGDGENGGY